MVAARLHSDITSGGGRFNVLLTRDRDREPEHWTSQLPRLMQPLGVRAYFAHTGREALDLFDQHPIHAALIDIATPQTTPGPGGGEGDGLWLLQVLTRRPNRPPIVVVNHRYTQRQAEHLLNEALRLGAFSVINRPQHVETLLQVIARLVQRQYQNTWPSPPEPQTPEAQPTEPPEDRPLEGP